MIDVLYNKLGSLNDATLAEWKDVPSAIFNKHVQRTQGSPHSRLIEKTSSIPAEIPAPIPAQEILPNTTKKTSANATKSAKPSTIKPLDILCGLGGIMDETASLHRTTEHIKESIIALITKDEFSKIFGMTKCAEIMSGIVNNRWNKSTALFISFFLDKEVYYNDKVIVYNKEKNNGRITI